MRVLRTLRARLTAAAVVAIAAAVVVFAVVTVVVVDRQLRGSLDSALRSRAQDVAQLAVSAPAVLTSPGALEGPGSGRELAVEVIDARGRIVARSLTLGAQLLPQDTLALAARRQGRTGVEDIELAGRPYRMYAAPIADAGGPAAGGAVLVASDTSDISRTVSKLVLSVVLSGILIVVLAALGAAILTRRGLRPLRRLAVAAGEIERTADPTRRLPTPPVADEIGQLTGVLNRMLASLEQARTSERRFLADASHELRTPVTALLGNVEYAVRHGADPEVLADLRADAMRLAHLVDALLALEREGAAPPAFEPVKLDQLVQAAVAQHDQRRMAVAPLASVTVLGDEEALRRAVSNLIENGLVHGPADGTVSVGVSRHDGLARIAVRDQGRGPGRDEHERLFERFWRGPDAAERPGAGLGLSIVAAIAERHGGRILVDGAEFTLELPVFGG
jgi:signal transduction histidine kinase